MSKARAADVYLVEQWNNHTGTTHERRNKIYTAFIELGMEDRWKYHKLAEDFRFSEEEKELLKCRTWEERAIAEWIGDDLKRVVFYNGTARLDKEELEWCTGQGGENEELISNDINAIPERVYSMTAFDNPMDVKEARQEHDQRHWVSGVYWIVNEDIKIIWVDEYGATIREKKCNKSELQSGNESFEQFKPFESVWWTEATKVGKYAGDHWWH